MKPRKQLEKPCGAGARQGLPEPPQIVALYIRVSTAHQVEGDSLEEQESELKKYCDYRGFRIHTILVEAGKSGGNTNRPEYQKLIKLIQQQKITAVIVKKLDRLSRSLLDFEQLMIMLQSNNVEFISLKESFDTTTAMGKAMLRIALVFAQLEREQTSERVSDVMQYRASLGLHNGGQPPFGYSCVNKEWVVFKKEKEVVELIFKRFRELKSTLQVSNMLNDMALQARRGKLWDCRRISEILQSVVYLGHRKWKEKVFQNTHPPIVTEKQFQEVAILLQKRSKVTNLNAPFQKLLICGECLSPMTPSYSLNHSKTKFYYYRCTQPYGVKQKKICTLKQIPFKVVTSRFLAAFAHFTTPTWLKSIENKVAQYNHTIEKEEALTKARIQTLEEKNATLKDQQDLFLNSLITASFSSKEKQRINTKLESLDLELKQIVTQLQHAQFNLTQQESEKLSLSHIKFSLMALQNLDPEEPQEFRNTLNLHITSITLYKTKLTLSLRFLPWELDFDG